MEFYCTEYLSLCQRILHYRGFKLSHIQLPHYVQLTLANPSQFVFKEYGRLTGYSLVLVHYIGTGKLWQIKRFGR